MRLRLDGIDRIGDRAHERGGLRIVAAARTCPAGCQPVLVSLNSLLTVILD